MALTRTWIDTQLSREQRGMLIDYLLERSANPTGAQIQDGIRELFPEKEPPSLNSCNEWRARGLTLEIQLRDIRNTSTVAEEIAKAAKDGMGLSDANAALLNRVVFDLLQADAESGTSMDMERLDALTKALARLRVGDHRSKLLAVKLREAEAKLREYEAKEAERAQRKAEMEKALNTLTKHGPSEETINQARAALKLM